MTNPYNARSGFQFSCARIYILLLAVFICPLGVMAQINLSAGTGNWNDPTKWSLGHVPLAGEQVTINTGHTISVNVNTALISDLVVDAGATLNVLNIASSTLSIDGTITVDGDLINNGKIDLIAPYAFTIGAAGTYTHNPRANVSSDETIFENGIESFANTSTLIIQKWNDLSVPLGDPNKVTGNFGNVILSVTGSWDQDGRFAPARIRGDLSITNGEVVMDDGTGNSNNLSLNNVTITGTGNVIFQAGANRSLTLTCTNFTDNSTSASFSRIMNLSYGNLTWNVNGDLSFNHKFFVVEGTLSEPASATINVAGDFYISGDSVSILRQVSGALNLNVTGNTTISGNPSYVRFMEGNTGIMTFNTNDFNIGGGNNNILVGGNPLIPLPTAGVFVNIGNDLNVTGNSTTYIVNSDININRTKITIGRNFNTSVAGANFIAANTNGNLLFDVANDFTMTSGNFTGQNFAGNIKADSIMIGGSFLFNSATAANYFYGNRGAGTTGGTVISVGGNFTINNSGIANGQGFNGVYQANSPLNFYVGGNFTLNQGRFNGIFNGDGNCTINIVGNYSHVNGQFYGIHNLVSLQSGIASFTANAVDFDRGHFSLFHANSLVSNITNFNVTTNVDITFFAAVDTFSVIGVELVEPASNESQLAFNIGGNLTISGAAGTFVSSKAKGREVVSIGGNVSLNGGVNSFNSSLLFTYPNGHPVVMNVTGNFTVTAGTNFISARSDSINCTIGGTLAITGGTLSLKGGAGVAKLTINGGFNQSAGNFFLHNSATIANTFATDMTVNADGDNNGDFTHSGGTFTFDNNSSTSSLPAVVTIKSPNYTLGPAGIMTKAANTAFGTIIFTRAGTITASRGNGHTLQEIKMKVTSGTTFDLVSGNLQIGSFSAVVGSTDFLWMDNGSVIDLHLGKIFSNNQYAYSGILVLQARVRTMHQNGLFNNTNNAAFDATGNMDYYLLPTSTVEYYGVDIQIVSGWNLGIATKSQHQYGNLEINFQGTPNTEWVYPTSFPNVTSVVVRSQLILTNGELNLDDDHNPFAGGKNIYIRSSNTAPIVRTNGYIRSETYGGLGNVIWRNTGGTTPTPSFTIPFAIDNSAPNYIPFTFASTAGKVDSIVVGTYGTIASNVPYPPGVLHVNNLGGVDNSAQTVDRFWYINTTGSVTAANIGYKCTANEALGITNPRSQRWVPLSLGWALPVGTQSNLVTGTQANGQNTLNGWWTLSALLNPLPVELVSFDATCLNEDMHVRWTTASEVNNEFFTLERSSDGFDFAEVARVKGAINSNSMLNYEIIDQQPLNGINYYRLKQTDTNGDFEYSDIISKAGCKTVKGVKFFTYVERDQNINLVMETTSSESAVVVVTDISGRLIYNKAVQVKSGFNQFVIPSSSFAQGMYIISLKGELNSFSDKIQLSK